MKKQILFLILAIGLFGISPDSTLAQTSSIEQCSYAGGTCYYGQANCPTLTHTMPGYCDTGRRDACCKARAVDEGPGSDAYCTSVLGGNCRTNDSGGCLGDEARVGACTVGPGLPRQDRVCCKKDPSRTFPTTVTGSLFENYQLLEQIPGTGNTVGTLKTYLEDIYKFAFWGIGIAAVFMLTVGGFMYLTSAGNTSRMESAKTVIFDSILGLVLALVAWLFLYVINPDLVNVVLPTISN